MNYQRNKNKDYLKFLNEIEVQKNSNHFKAKKFNHLFEESKKDTRAIFLKY